MRSVFTYAVILLAAASAARAVASQPIAVELTGAVEETSDQLGVFLAVNTGDVVSIRIVIDTSIPSATTVFVETGPTQVTGQVLAPVVLSDGVQFFGVLPDIEGVDADGGVTVSLALPSTSELDASAYNATILDDSFGRISYASLVSVDPLVIDESAFRVRFDSVQAEALDIPTALCRPVDFDQNGTVDVEDRAFLIAAIQSFADGDDMPERLDLDGDGEVTANDLGEAVFLLNRCSNEGPVGQPLVDVLDLTGDDRINILDLVLFIELFNGGQAAADVDQNGSVDFFDFITFLDGFDVAVLF